MGDFLSLGGMHGWRLLAVYDKSSNWWGGMEKGFLLLMREVPEGVEPRQWCIITDTPTRHNEDPPDDRLGKRLLGVSPMCCSRWRRDGGTPRWH
jgi:hypothetical protein